MNITKCYLDLRRPTGIAVSSFFAALLESLYELRLLLKCRPRHPKGQGLQLCPDTG